MEQIEAASEAVTYVYERVVEYKQEIDAVNTQILAEQNEMISEAADALWDAHVLSVELQIQQQYQRDMAVISQWEFVSQHPVKSIDGAFMIIGDVSAYYSVVGLIAAPTLGGVVGAVFAVGGAVWATLRYFEIIPNEES